MPIQLKVHFYIAKLSCCIWYACAGTDRRNGRAIHV